MAKQSSSVKTDSDIVERVRALAWAGQHAQAIGIASQELGRSDWSRSIPEGACVGRLMRYDYTFRTKVVTEIKRPSDATRPSIMCVAAILSNDVMDNRPFA